MPVRETHTVDEDEVDELFFVCSVDALDLLEEPDEEFPSGNAAL